MRSTSLEAYTLSQPSTYCGNSLSILFALLLSVLMSLLSTDTFGNSPTLSDNPELKKQRQLFKEARKAYKKQHTQRYHTLKKQLVNYPLYPYLSYSELNSQLSSLPYQQVDQFFKDYSDSYLAQRLRKRWLKELSSKQRWQSYIDYFQADLKSNTLECLYLQAQLKLGQTFDQQLALDLWMSGSSQPDECNPAFKRLKQQQQLTSERIWQRHNLAIQKRNLGLARYLRKKLPARLQKLAQLHEQVHKTPAEVNVIHSFAHYPEQVADIVYHGIYRHAYKAPESALAYYHKISDQYVFDLARDVKLKNRLITRLIADDKLSPAITLLNSLSIDQRSDSVESLLRVLLRNRQWDQVNHWINQLPEDIAKTDRWQYWKARSLEALAGFNNLDNEPFNHQDIYANLAGKRSFYGFLSADKQGTPYFFEDKPASVNLEIITKVKQQASIQRAKEFFILGEMHRARREWAYGVSEFSEDEYIAAGQLSHLWGWHRKSIEVMAKAQYWDDLAIRFPIVHENIVAKNAKQKSISPSLIFAIARQESAWEFDARSRVGARGLMQIMPATARETAKKSGLPYSKKRLFEPSYNIALGSHYISGLLSRFNNNRPLAIAAYNAGPHRVKKWRERSQSQLPTDIWIEIIPFKETRKYVQNVLSYEVIYNYRRGQRQQLLTLAEAGTPL